MAQKTYREKMNELCENMWYDYLDTGDIRAVDRVLKTYIGKFKRFANSCDKKIEQLKSKNKK